MTPFPFVLAASARAGGNFLMDLLTSTGMVGDVKERLQSYRLKNLSDAQVKDLFDEMYEASVPACPDSSARPGTGASDNWGMKVDMRDLFVLEHYLWVRGLRPENLKWIWLKRINKAKQTLSYLKAIETGRFHLLKSDSPEAFEQDKAQVDFDMRVCKDYMLRFFIIEHTWLHYFRSHGIEPHTIYYEDFVDESVWEPTVQGIFDYLGISYKLPLHMSSEHVKRHENHADAVYKELKKLMPHYPYHYTFFGGSDKSPIRSGQARPRKD